jgi:hypothetical protein
MSVLAFTREASCFRCTPDLPLFFFLRSFYYVPTTEAPLGLLGVRTHPCHYGVDGCVRFSSHILSCFTSYLHFHFHFHSLHSGELMFSITIHILPFFCFVFWMNCVASFAFCALRWDGDVAFERRYFSLGLELELGCECALATFSRTEARALDAFMN